MIRPNPLQAGQAPIGWLNENSAGVGSLWSMSQVAQWNPAEKHRASPGIGPRRVSFPWPKR